MPTDTRPAVDLSTAFGQSPSTYDAGFRDAVESFVVAGVDAQAVQTVLDAFTNNAPETPVDPAVQALLVQAATALRAAEPFLGTHEPGPHARWTAHQRAGAMARDAVAALEAEHVAPPFALPLDPRARAPLRTAFVASAVDGGHVRIVAHDGLIVGQCEHGVYAAGDGERNARWLVAAGNKTRHLPLELLESPDYALSLVRRPAPVRQEALALG